MGISVADNFSYLGGKPLDGRIQYATLAAMKAMADATLYEGCEAYCVATDKYYQWKSLNTVDADTGKWREVEGGSGSIPVASANTLGGVKIGSGISVQSDGTISTSGGGGGLMEATLLFGEEANSTTLQTSGTITLTEPYTNYSFIVMYNCVNGRATANPYLNHMGESCLMTLPCAILEKTRTHDNLILTCSGYDKRYLQWIVDSTTQFTIIAQSDMGINKIYGIK